MGGKTSVYCLCQMAAVLARLQTLMSEERINLILLVSAFTVHHSPAKQISDALYVHLEVRENVCSTFNVQQPSAIRVIIYFLQC